MEYLRWFFDTSAKRKHFWPCVSNTVSELKNWAKHIDMYGRLIDSAP